MLHNLLRVDSLSKTAPILAMIPNAFDEDRDARLFSGIKKAHRQTGRSAETLRKFSGVAGETL